MDLRFTADELAFRDEVRHFMRTALPPDIRRKMVEGRHIGKDDIVIWQRILNAKGWAVPHWPKEFPLMGAGMFRTFEDNEGGVLHSRPLRVRGCFKRKGVTGSGLEAPTCTHTSVIGEDARSPERVLPARL